MRRTIALLATMALTLLVTSGLVLVAGGGSATADSSVVGPGESIQKAIKAADPGDTIIVRGVHKEDVFIGKNGIKLRGDDAVIESPPRAKADSPCSKANGPTAICVLGDFNFETGEVNKRVRDVSVSGFTFRGFKDKDALVIDVTAARNATVVGNRLTGNVAKGMGFGLSVNSTIAKNHIVGSPKTEGADIAVEASSSTTVAGNDLINGSFGLVLIDSTGTNKILSNDITDSTASGMLILGSPGTKILSNDIRRPGEAGIFIFGPERVSNAGKVVGNRISGGEWGILLQIAHGGTFAGNTIRNNCAGMMIESFGFDEPVVGLEVTGNTVENNTRSCQDENRNFSGIGIALFSTKDMEVTGNHLSGNIPSGPTPVSGGVVVADNPYDDSSRGPKPTNNSVIGNTFGRNKPDIFYDGSGSGNRFVGNLCNTSVPTRLCN
jgi:parallel beta-helix repeat protein